MNATSGFSLFLLIACIAFGGVIQYYKTGSWIGFVAFVAGSVGVIIMLVLRLSGAFGP